MAETHPTVELARGTLKRVGGAVALDFVNTLDWRLDKAAAAEWLLSYRDLVVWAKSTGALDASRARRLLALAKENPETAAGIVSEARRLREALFRIFAARSREKAPVAKDLALVNRWLQRAAPRSSLDLRGRRLGWQWPDESLESVLAPILWSAGDLLTNEGRIKLCAADGCGWIFLDASRKANRVWCSMEGCGNRAKARRHYRRRTSG